MSHRRPAAAALTTRAYRRLPTTVRGAVEARRSAVGTLSAPSGAGGAGRADDGMGAGRQSWEEADGQESQGVTPCQSRPNKGLQPTAYSVRSCVAPASSGS